MKKLLYITLLLVAAGAQAAVNFDIWNKTEQPLYFQLGTQENPPSDQDLIELGASGAEASSIKDRLKSAASFFGKKAAGIKSKGDAFYQSTIDTSQKTVILLSRTPELGTGAQAVLITINRPNKDIFIRIKPDSAGNIKFAGDNQKYLVGPQTGPLMGMGGKTERNLPLGNNIKQSDIVVNAT